MFPPPVFPPPAHLVLWTLGSFLACYGVSLIVRARRRRRATRACPTCHAVIPKSTLACAACGFEAASHKEFIASGSTFAAIASGIVLIIAGVVCFPIGEWIRGWGTYYGRNDSPIGPVGGACLGVAAFGIVLAVRGWFGDRSRGRARCPKCWYSLAGRGESRLCPECGHDPADPKDLFRTRRSRRLIAVGASLVLASSIVPFGVAGVRYGWRAAVPTTPMILALPWLPDALLNDNLSSANFDETLAGRYYNGELWAWQLVLLQRRARGLFDGTPSPRELYAVICFMDIVPDMPNEHFIRGVIEALLSDSARDQVIGSYASEWFFQPLFPDLIDAYGERLLARVQDPGSTVRIECARVLAFGNDLERGKTAGEFLVTQLRAPPSPQSRSTITSVLAQSSNPAVMEIMRSLATDPDPSLRAESTEFVEDPAILTMLCFDPDGRVRTGGFYALACRRHYDEMIDVLQRSFHIGSTVDPDDFFDQLVMPYFIIAWSDPALEAALDDMMHGPHDEAALAATQTLLKKRSELRHSHDWSTIEARARRIADDQQLPARVSARAKAVLQALTPDTPEPSAQPE